jgi:hypothetical protein
MAGGALTMEKSALMHMSMLLFPQSTITLENQNTQRPAIRVADALFFQ